MDFPSKTLLSIEAIRSLYEFGLGWLLNMPLQYISPKGDGHPVMIIPGLGTSDTSTYYLRNFLNGIGYEAYSWGLGRNLGPRQGIDKLHKQLVNRVFEISSNHDNQSVSIIGWSLGGIYGREIAKSIPDNIRQVIALGTPFKCDAGGIHASFLYEFLSKDKDYKNIETIKKISEPPPVPFTSLYSKTDGVVHWRCSLEVEGPITENIEIPGASHMGLGHNPISMYIIANRLAQSRELWLPYKK